MGHLSNTMDDARILLYGARKIEQFLSKVVRGTKSMTPKPSLSTKKKSSFGLLYFIFSSAFIEWDYWLCKPKLNKLQITLVSGHLRQKKKKEGLVYFLYFFN